MKGFIRIKDRIVSLAGVMTIYATGNGMMRGSWLMINYFDGNKIEIFSEETKFAKQELDKLIDLLNVKEAPNE